jgi:histidyl-tRNA synthetase
MAFVPSIMKLHLRYRLFIAEMNFDINLLRIFDDYLAEIKLKKNEPEISLGINRFEKQFAAVRHEIDELRHEMHLLKMKLAALARDNRLLDRKTYQSDNHKLLYARYKAYRRNFENLKKEISNF